MYPLCGSLRVYTRTAKMLGKCPVSDYYLELCDLSVTHIARSLLPVPIAMQKLYNKFIIAIPMVGQYGEIFRSQSRYPTTLWSGRYGRS